ncbi:ferritin-like domain-containing protein [Piscinibacter terrae]|uniref:Iron-binding zinc finger CDGSH type domain-containing protein n=1 Tax=Piscinibacter terrae TaxID=2496871 RepID=A0A3N7HNU2_9BURK|nr:ferritin-like domain-containing protein [Albitalea terrae]RQP23868.1 hypothetical protein DZC73_17290 [Albitalea terrae]
MIPESNIVIRSREQLLYTLSEASEIEHNLMCCYLYAAWSLKTEDDDGVDDEVRAELKRWQRVIVHVAIDEMSHLALVANLMNALGGAAHLHRPNFPISSGYHPAGLQVKLAPFSRATLQHFIYLERPEGSDEPDGEGFEVALNYRRGLNGLELMPSAQDFPTVGHLYHSVEAALRELSGALGERQLFCGDPDLQVGPDIVQLPGLLPVTDLASACRAIQTIVEQGEGSQADTANSHFQRFIGIRTAHERLMAERPDFSPAHPAAHNPVMRRPPDPKGKVWVQLDAPRSALDLGNAVYNHMLRFLAQGFGETQRERKRDLINAGIDLMFAIDPLAKELARLRANDTDDCHAGLSFATLRSYPVIHPDVAQATLVTRLAELCEGNPKLERTPRVAAALAALSATHARLSPGTADMPVAVAQPEKPVDVPAPTEEAVAVTANSEPEVVEGTEMRLIFDAKRCIHARFCVTGAPKTFLANVQGPWLHPDRTPLARLIEVAHACPSGAVQYRRKDGQPDEAAPEVNLLHVRENGPYAVRAPLVLSGQDAGFRATLCRCGASANKPFCDGSHQAASFSASGEPVTISLDALSVRDGPLRVDPQQNGPLQVSGNLEICSGTGRVVQRVTQAKLCRCGQSKSKPFCDGSHRAAGFVAAGA